MLSSEANALDWLEHRNKLVAPKECFPSFFLSFANATLVFATHHITSHHITSHHITSHHITSHHITSHHITSHHITSHHSTAQRELFLFARDKGMDNMHEMQWIVW